MACAFVSEQGGYMESRWFRT